MARFFAFTYHVPYETEQDVVQDKTGHFKWLVGYMKPKCKEGIFSLEKGEEKGRSHFQGVWNSMKVKRVTDCLTG